MHHAWIAVCMYVSMCAICVHEREQGREGAQTPKRVASVSENAWEMGPTRPLFSFNNGGGD